MNIEAKYSPATESGTIGTFIYSATAGESLETVEALAFDDLAIDYTGHAVKTFDLEKENENNRVGFVVYEKATK